MSLLRPGRFLGVPRVDQITSRPRSCSISNTGIQYTLAERSATLRPPAIRKRFRSLPGGSLTTDTPSTAWPLLPSSGSTRKIQAPRKPVSCPSSDASSIPIVRFITAAPVSYTCPVKKTLRSYCHLLASTVIPKLFRVDGTRGAVPLTSRAIFGIRLGVVLETK